MSTDDGKRHVSEIAAQLVELRERLRALEVAANTVDYCYGRRPENFGVALRDLKDEAAKARELLAKAGQS